MSKAVRKILSGLKLVTINVVVLWVLLNIVGYGVAKHHFSVLKNRYETGVVANNIFLEKVFRTNLASIRPLPQYVGTYDTLTYYWNTPGTFNLAVFDTDYTVRHNIHGLRVQKNASSNARMPNVAILGDSHAYGIGVNNETTYASMLAEQGFPVSLVACSSFGTAREVMKTKALCEAGIIDTPEVVVVHYCSNDLSENEAFVANNFTLKKKSEASFHENFLRDRYEITFSEVYDKLPVYMSLPLFFRGMSNKVAYLFSQSRFTYFTHPSSIESLEREVVEHTIDNVFSDVMAYMLEDSLFSDVKQLVILNAMSPAHHSKAEIQQEESMLTASASDLQKRFPNVNVSTLFIPEAEQSECYFIMDDHTNVEGHAWYAEALKQRIQNHTKQ